MNNNKVSIIIPVYNVESYIDECLNSVVNQTYQNLEIILVDDGSPDKCPQICDNWAEKDYRIKVVHKKNGGLSSARNAGMDVATGSFLMFVDSDDFIEKNMVADLLQSQEQTGADVVCCEINRYSQGKYVLMDIFHSDKASYTISSTQFLEKLFLTEVSCASWNKLYKKNILQGVRFPIGIYNEDIVFLFELFQNKEISVTLINKALYNYRVTPNSVTTTFGKRNLDYLYNAQKFEKIIHKNRIDLYSFFCVYMSRVSIDTGWMLIKNKAVNQYKEEYVYCRKYIKSKLLKILFSYPLPFRWKVHSLIICVK